MFIELSRETSLISITFLLLSLTFNPMLSPNLLQNLIILAGIGQILLCLGSLFIPKLLNWKSELANVSPLIRKIFWVYAAYILTTNFSFGILSLIASSSLMDGSVLAFCISAFIFLYWVSRLVIQFTVFSKYSPEGKIYRFGEIGLVIAFIYFTIIYALTFYYNLRIDG